VQELALVAPAFVCHAIMLDQAPEVIWPLQIQSLPVLFLNQRQVSGPVNEWIIASYLTMLANDGS
jgi:hypothetical protein